MDKLVLGDAGALVAFSSAANAGITIPAGDWTVDLGGNVNAFYTNVTGGGKPATNSIGTGLLPAELGVGAKTRQNDLDIAVQFSFFTGTAYGAPAVGAGGNSLNIRQAYVSFGDASWGTIKLGRDLGIYGSDAILSDMTLLGVGQGAAGGNSTLGRIGAGYMYANWYGQVAYSTPNWNGFQVTGAVLEPIGDLAQNNPDFQAKATYDFAANDVTGRVWLGGIYQSHSTSATNASNKFDTKGFDLGAKAAFQGAELVGYYYNGDNLQAGTLGTAASGTSGVLGGNTGSASTSDSGGYVQATFKIPGVGTKLGASWGENLSTSSTGVEWKNEAYTVGAYHPLTKSLNLVLEYTREKETNNSWTAHAEVTSNVVAAGAILFF